MIKMEETIKDSYDINEKEQCLKDIWILLKKKSEILKQNDIYIIDFFDKLGILFQKEHKCQKLAEKNSCIRLYFHREHLEFQWFEYNLSTKQSTIKKLYKCPYCDLELHEEKITIKID
jgi:hypothetical protein